MTWKEKFIYNCYLTTTRKLNNKPFKYRQDFSKFEEREEYPYIVKLDNFFNKFPQLNIKDFFEAPYFVYDEKFFDLKFYTSQRAIKAYTIYQNDFLPNNPDHTQTLTKIKDSFIFIYKFCVKQNITLDQYASFIDPEHKVHSFMLHLKNRDISLYAMFIFPGFDKILNQYDNEIKNFFYGEMLNKLNFYRTKYYSSNKAKKLCISAYNRLISHKK